MSKKRWPADALMIVAARHGLENRAEMESVIAVECRDCGAKLAADSKTIRLAKALPARRDRPIKFFCTSCCVQYERESVTEFHDHRGKAQEPVADGPPLMTMCRPLCANHASPPAGAVAVTCPYCDRAVWRMPGEPSPLPPGWIAACTDCALKRSQHQRAMDDELARRKAP